MADNVLDAYIARFQNIPGVNLYAVVDDGQSAVPWYAVQMTTVVADLVVNELTIPSQLGVVTAEIQKWGRLTALGKRVWELEERKYRAWRSEFYLGLSDPAGKAEGWKKPTEGGIEALYRTQAEYHRLQANVERAEEAFNTAESILHAFRAKKDVLIALKRKYHEDGASTAL
jgi:hypothetical protein